MTEAAARRLQDLALEHPSLKRFVTVGTFDGVHRGHQALLARLVERARELKMRSLVLLFAKPPRFFFHPRSASPLLTLPEERVRLLQGLGVEDVVVLEFDRSVASTTPQGFLEDILGARLHAAGMLAGADFVFGRGRRGTVRTLKTFGARTGFAVEIFPFVEARSRKVSSTELRELVSAGGLGRVRSLLGRSYPVAGQVIRGRGMGRELGFPTANLKVHPDKLLPPGVSRVRVRLAGGSRWRRGAVNVGTRPTFNGQVPADAPVSVEVHLPGFRGDLYGKRLEIEFVSRIREERRFPSLEDLKSQIRRDIQSLLKK